MHTVWFPPAAGRRTVAGGAWLAAGLSGLALGIDILHPQAGLSWLLPGCLLAALAAWALTAAVATVRVAEPPDLEPHGLLFATHPQPVLVIDTVGLGIRAANPAACEKYGYTPDAFAALTVFDLYRPEDREVVRAEWAALTDRPRDERRAARHVAKNGTEFSVELSSSSLRIAGQRVRIIVVTDIADRGPVRKEGPGTNARYRQVVDTAHEGVLTVDPEMTISDANQPTADMLGYPIDELIGHPMSEFYGPGMADAAARQAAQRTAGVLAEKHEVTLQNREGLPVPVIINEGPLLDTEGNYEGQLSMIADLTERRGFQEKLAFQALHDPLTGLPNRILLAERLQLALEPTTDRHGGVAVALVDIDGFRMVNSAHGTGGGDALLLETARRLSATVAEGDTVARFGGNEFVVLSEHSMDNAAAVQLLADRLRAGLTAPCPIGNTQVPFTVSIGGAIGRRGDRPGTVLRSADMALLKAKTSGGARTEFFTSALAAASRRRLAIASDLRHALDRGEFSLRFQPVVALADGSIVGAEALVRWEHPRRGTLSPAEFITVAEETGAIGPIGQWVIEETCRQFAGWQTLVPALSVSVNVSAHQIMAGNLHEVVRNAVAATGLDASHLTLEITESVLMDDVALSRAVLASLRATAVKISVDDFGTGYSSLSYLNTFPLDALKIDQSFVAGIPGNACDTALIEAIVAIAAALGLSVIAEGIESQAQTTALLGLGCQQGQGYYFHRPLSPEVFKAELLASRVAPSADQASQNSYRDPER
ncbi:MAG: sensor domain-containing protein [Candidatus Dormibacteria bacterium]